MNTRVYFLLFLFVLFITCKKDNLSIPSSVEIGNTTGMDVKVMNYDLIADRYNPVDFKLDVDKDGKDDIGFLVEYAYSPGGGENGCQTITSLNDGISFKVAPVEENVYVDFYTYSFVWLPPTITVRRNTHYFFEGSSADSLSSINHIPSKIIDLPNSYLLSSADTFMKTSYVYQDWNNDPGLYYTYKSNDTSYEYFANKKTNENPYKWNKEICFAFKLKNGNDVRLGWLKFMILNKGATRLIETAIQKK